MKNGDKVVLITPWLPCLDGKTGVITNENPLNDKSDSKIVNFENDYFGDNTLSIVINAGYLKKAG